MSDHYEVLQVHPRAEPDVIRAAYRILARKYHPDMGGDANRMIAINDAWDVLGDPARRAAYDAKRSSNRDLQSPAAPPAQSGATVSGSGQARPAQVGHGTRRAAARPSVGDRPRLRTVCRMVIGRDCQVRHRLPGVVGACHLWPSSARGDRRSPAAASRPRRPFGLEPGLAKPILSPLAAVRSTAAPIAFASAEAHALIPTEENHR